LTNRHPRCDPLRRKPLHFLLNSEGTMSKKDIRSSILFAAAPDSIQTLGAVLGDEFNIISCSTMDQAQAALSAHKIDLIVCESHFDNCRMFDLLRYCKLTPDTRDIPFLSMRLSGGELDDTAYEAVEIASKALGAVAFIDFFRLSKTLGAEELDKKLRLCIRLNAAGDLPD
jgi:response regulator RpfG family c-di-GMP phosphodiesterase